MEQQGDLFGCPRTHSMAHCISQDCRMGKGVAVAFKTKFGGVQDLLKQGRCVKDRRIYTPTSCLSFNLMIAEDELSFMLLIFKCKDTYSFHIPFSIGLLSLYRDYIYNKFSIGVLDLSMRRKRNQFLVGEQCQFIFFSTITFRDGSGNPEPRGVD